MRGDRDRIRFTITDFMTINHFLKLAEKEFDHRPETLEELQRVKKKIEQAMIKLKKRRAV